MVWNIDFQIAAFIIISVTMYLCLREKRLVFRAETYFVRLLYAVMASTVFDVLSIVAINYTDRIGPILTQIVCKMYLLSIVTVAFIASHFISADVNHCFPRILNTASGFPLGIEMAILLVFPVDVYVDLETDSLYTTGVPVLVTYLFCFVYITSSFVVLFTHKADIPYRKRRAVYGWLGCWILAAVIQGLNNRLLVVSFAMSVGCVYMYSKIENPDYNLEFSYNIFNRRAFGHMMDDILRFKKHRAMIAFRIANVTTIREIFGNTTSRRFTEIIVDYIKTIPGVFVFALEDDMFALITKDDMIPDNVDEMVDKMVKRFAQSWEVNESRIASDVNIVYFYDASYFGETREVEEVLHYFLSDAHKKNLPSLLIDDDELEARKRSIEVQHALEWALSNDGVEMFYQPIYDIKAGRFSALEALVRIRDENGNLIMPAEFIEFAEKNGKILELGEQIFKSVCRFIQQNKIEKYGIEYVEVNLSVVQCMQDDLAKTYMEIMSEYNVPPHRINLEITETAAVNSKTTLKENMNSLLAYGNTFSLDDYGTGYSNLIYIIQMPLHIIKIDRTLTLSYMGSLKAKTATEYTVEMAHALGLKIVVEGIETEEQYLAFKKLGVEYIQGYYFSKPLSKERVLSFVQEWL